MTDTAPVGLAVTGIQVQTSVNDGHLSGDITVTYATAAGGNIALHIGSFDVPMSRAFNQSPVLKALTTLLTGTYSVWEEQHDKY